MAIFFSCLFNFILNKHKKMQKKISKKTCIVLLLSSDSPTPIKFLDNYPNFKLFLSEGISSFLIKPKSSFLLSSILGFSKSSSKLLENSDPINPCELKKFDHVFLEEKTQIIEEDTMTEIRYIECPKAFSQISSRLRAVVLTNSKKTAFFCRNIFLDYYFDEEMGVLTKNSEFLTKLISGEEYELVILDIISEKSHLQDILTVFDKEIIDVDSENLSYYLLINPYLQGENIEKVINSHKTAGLDPFISKIIPKQTYEYLNGSINKDFIEISKNFQDFELVFCCLYEKGGCRKDKITEFALLDENPLKAAKLAGNKVVNSHIFLREITFRLGKLPKFGA